MTDNHISFPELGVDKKILDILAKLKFTVPTPIQAKAIPIAAEGKDIIGIAQTGTGKTLAFGIPMIQMLAKNGGKGLILLPTRELALQVNEALLHFIPAFKMKSLVIIGGHDMQGQVDAIGQSPDIIIATPGRLIDHLNRGNLELNKVNFLVLDEADRMLDMGFLRDIQEILSVISKKRQT
ncbi:MAG TPA: DEAD/DEAH box helicase, partial [Candidatus Goldiibacteriota bacterium]|nr:DEAD/DEAH box helicase [Candidatus Goldiibacteriota bacterium]